MSCGSGDDWKFQIEFLNKNIQSSERLVRQQSLTKLLELCESTQLTETEAMELFDLCYLSILKCYSDKFESCRNSSVLLITAILRHLPDNDFYIETIVPVLTRRIGRTEIVEDSEEMRLLFVEQLFQLIQKFTSQNADKDPLQGVYNDIIDILIKTLRDPYPVVQRISCNVVRALAAATTSFHGRAEQLAIPLISMLGHRQSPSRIAAIETLGIVSLYIHTNADVIIKVIVSISPLLMDEMPFVRRECGRVGCFWLMNLRDRYSFFERILPLVLCW